MLDYVRLCQIVLDYVGLCRLCQIVLGYARLCQIMLNQFILGQICQIMLDYVRLCQIMLDYARLCQIMLGYVRLCQTMLDYSTLGVNMQALGSIFNPTDMQWSGVLDHRVQHSSLELDTYSSLFNPRGQDSSLGVNKTVFYVLWSLKEFAQAQIS